MWQSAMSESQIYIEGNIGKVGRGPQGLMEADPSLQQPLKERMI